ncbi:MAG: ATP synthase subunit I [Cellvibrionaceae bacterium]
MTKLFGWQVVVLAVLVIPFSLRGTEAVYSVLLGGLLAIVPGAIFARYAFRYMGASRAQDVVRSLYLGELLKLVACVVGFAVVFQWVKQLDFAAFWVSYVIGLFVPAIAAGLGALNSPAKIVRAGR